MAAECCDQHLYNDDDDDDCTATTTPEETQRERIIRKGFLNRRSRKRKGEAGGVGVCAQ